MNPVESYFKTIHEIRSTGGAVPETSYYPALANLLDAVGAELKPKVRCVSQVASTGAGSPDFGLYSEDQFQKTKDIEPMKGQMPERGVIEVKGLKDDTWITAEGAQVSKYWGHYRQVLVTNYRDFVFLGQDDTGQQIKLETLRLAENEAEFHTRCMHPRIFAQNAGERLVEYLRRVMLNSTPLGEPQVVAWYLASYAREAKARIDEASDLDGLNVLKNALELSLGMKFGSVSQNAKEHEKGDHFFKATLVQTLFYGVFSSWVLWARKHGNSKAARFNWHEAAWGLHVPMIAGLFEQIATPQKLKPLKLDEVMDWTGMVLNRVDVERFFSTFEEEHAVQYFYEPFLKAYDPELRKDLGVWYTPPEIVKYQVVRVDAVLREELDIPDGLADPNVYVLDPCCGTGAYLVEVLHRIHDTFEKQGVGALMAQKLKKAAMERVFGFEILPAPFVVSHLQIGLLLSGYGAPLSDDTNERAAVYLTNALTGWEPPKEPKTRLPFKELEEERDAAEHVKRDVPILVVLGNPPYNAFAGTSPEEEAGLVDSYKELLNTPVDQGGWGIKKFNLDDLYVRFFRIAERRIVKTGQGVVSFISNHSWVTEPSFVVLRERLLSGFDKLWIENLHGNRKISEYAPDGNTSETIFAIQGFSSGIQQGVVTSLWVKTLRRKKKKADILFRDDINAARASDRRQQLIDSLKSRSFNKQYQLASPDKENRYSFRPMDTSAEYMSWPKVTDLCAVDPSNGLMEKRGGALIDIDRQKLEKRMQMYFDISIPWDEYKSYNYGLTKHQSGFDPLSARKKIQQLEKYEISRIINYAVRPFDNQFCYYTQVNPIWNRARPALWTQCWEGNKFLLTRPAGVANPEGCPFYFTSCIGDNDLQRGHSYYFPLRLKNENKKSNRDVMTGSLFDEQEPCNIIIANLSSKARSYLTSLKYTDIDEEENVSSVIWLHALAIGYSPQYLEENRDGIRQDWPRIPLPAEKTVLSESAVLGAEVAALLDPETSVAGVTSGTLHHEFTVMGAMGRVGGGAVNPAAGELDVTAGWGHAGKGGITMPARGRIVKRAYSPDEIKELNRGAKRMGITTDSALSVLGESVCDVYINDTVYWQCIPEGVWEYRIGGYQVIKKWLSYREKELLGRGLLLEEAEYITEIVRRIAALLLMTSRLDGNYARVKENCYNFNNENEKIQN